MKLSDLYPNECMTTNLVHEWADITSDSGVIEEPVTLEEFKTYARLEGFQDDNGGDELPFTSDDALIEELITGARQSIEAFTGRSLIGHTWAARVTGKPVLPFSNGATVTQVKDADQEVINPADYIVRGLDFKFVDTWFNNATITYDTDGNCPTRLKTAILAETLYRYENRGDVQDEGRLCEKALAIAVTFKTTSTWLA